MLKQVVIKNFYNFADEQVLDFSISQNSIPEKIALLYGKNNVGKSNAVKLIEQGINFILHKKLELLPNLNTKNETSYLEYTFSAGENEYRYGYEIEWTKDTPAIIDEWFFAKINASSRETCIFDRKRQKAGKVVRKSDFSFTKNVKSDELYLSYLRITNTPIIDDLINNFKRVFFLPCLDDLNKKFESGIFHKQLQKLFENQDELYMITEHIKNMDTGIAKIKIEKFEDSEVEQWGTLLEHVDSTDDSERKQAIAALKKRERLPKYLWGIRENQDQAYFSITFEDLHGNIFEYLQISSGTRQLFNILLVFLIISSAEYDSVLFLDEVEAALHNDVLFSLFDYINEIQEKRNIQVIATTHNEKLLDLPYIKKESVLLLKSDVTMNGAFVDYLSNYKIKKEHVLSRRYNLNAFGTSPKING